MPRTEQATGTELLAKRDRDSAEDSEKQHSCKIKPLVIQVKGPKGSLFL